MCRLSTQVNDSDLAAYITVFDPRRDKRRRFIPCLFYALVYPSIDSNILTLATRSPLCDSVEEHRGICGNITTRLDNGAFAGLI